MPAPIPTHVVAGPLGCGKTTLIAQWLAGKPANENWVVLLNEYSEAGIDALTVASAARGAYDVRLIPGGCLCCAGEDDFRRNLRTLVEDVRPARILVEPSGVGHPAGMVEELLAHEAAGELELEGIVSLIDPARLDRALDAAEELLQAQLEIGDALVLTKADLATPAQRTQFAALCERVEPRKAWVGASENGRLPFAALQAGLQRRTDQRAAVAARGRPASHRPHGHGDDAAGAVQTAAGGLRRPVALVGYDGACWEFPRAIGFDEDRLLALLPAGLAGAVRFKAVLRVAEDRWVLLQHDGARFDLRESSWRRDSRAEIIFPQGRRIDWPRLDALLARAQAVPR